MKKTLTEEQYLIKFAKLDQVEQIIILQESLNVSEVVAKEYFNLILNTIKRKDFLFNLFNRKKDDLETLKPILNQINESEIEQIKKKNIVKETRLQIKIKMLLPLISQLRQSGVGWRRIENYLRKEKKLKTSANTIRRYFEKYKYLLNQ